MKLTAGQAAKQTGKSVPTIVRAFQKGRISGEKTEGGGYLFDASELFRVFPPVTQNVTHETPSLGHETPFEANLLQVEVEVLRERLRGIEEERHRERAQLERERGQLVGQIEDLQKDRDHWREQAERTTKLLPAPVSLVAPERAKRRWWHFGKANS